MYVLALDTALAACSAAVLDTRHGILASASVAMRRGHAEALLPAVHQVMDDAGVAFSDLDRIAVTVGPGSFTGLRVGVSAARGIALAARRPAVGITTLAAFAAPALILAQGTPVLAVIDARHGQFYAQTFGGGGATEARIALQAQNGSLRFSVSDDGAGYDARHTPMGSGLRNMSDRLAALGGRLEVRSAPSQGTTITGHLPIPSASDGHERAIVADSPAAANRTPGGALAGRDASDN